MVRIRFAPSPTGFLHLGNARIAVVNALFARRHGGAFVLRIDDTDTARSDEAYTAAIREDLSWLGLRRDEEYRQSEHGEVYEGAFERLVTSGAVYACTETGPELAAWRRERSRPAYKPGVLPGGGGPAYWRFALGHERLGFTDLVLGERPVDLGSLSDPVVRRADGSFTYLFASAVDDVTLGITHVIRGADHVTNTGTQIRIARALDAPEPAFAHLPLVLGPDGEGLSKRHGSLSLRELRARGVEPLAIVQLLAALGTDTAADPAADLDRLAVTLDLAGYGHASPRLDPVDLERQSAEVVRRLPWTAVGHRLPGLIDEPFWHAVRANLDRVEDALDWWRVVHESMEPRIEDAAFLQLAADLLPDPVDFDTWVVALKRATGRKGRELFHPLRLALTGRERGPELKVLLAVLPRDRALGRLRGQIA
ncbi:MAG: glutamate--tRNA ligase [Geminicoccaceae bacterium]